MAKDVITIPASKSKFTAAPLTSTNKRKVAAYARVSTDHEEQLTSYEAQVDYYTKYIKERGDWEFVAVYADEGITGTNTKKRDGFNKMVEDALAGKIDLIITKSVSRFARNTVDSLTTIRKLKENGTECFFEKENIWTFDGKGELLLTIMSSLAQEESRSISENCTWGQRKRMADGKVAVPYGRFLGYDKGPDGNLVINEEQAKVVRKIYDMFLMSMSPRMIARKLTEEGIPTPGGKAKWNDGTIRSILTNEKYKGDALLQKEYTTDFLTKKKKKNEGEVPQYYVKGNHEPIIDPKTFDLVQSMFAARSTTAGRISSSCIYSSKVKCGTCGAWYGAKVWHSNDKYRRIVWQCNHKYKEKKCPSPHVTEEQIKEAFLSAANKLIADRDEIIETFESVLSPKLETESLEQQLQELNAEINNVAKQIDECIAENAHRILDQEEYNERFRKLTEKSENLEMQYAETSNGIIMRRARRQKINLFLQHLKEKDLLAEFKDEDWLSMVDYITVKDKDNITVTFKDGTEIKA